MQINKTDKSVLPEPVYLMYKVAIFMDFCTLTEKYIQDHRNYMNW